MSEVNENELGFDWLANVYNSQGAINHPSELHGIMLGYASGGERYKPEQWLKQVLDHMGLEAFDTSRQVNVQNDLQLFYEESLNELDKDSSSVQLLLPDDDYEIQERLEALAAWVRGFLEGLAYAAGDGLTKVEDDSREMLQDLVKISQLDSRVPPGEDAEREYSEVSEYVRIGMLNLFAEFNHPALDQSDSTPDSQNPTLH